ncbi:glycosyl hydrolase [Burkholderia sp. Ax-1719]|uniref:glycosyl hydrolase n=1 Tax=Burkholderia sp. Ax-1719 TaxID=2608334 RepID=UPI00141EF8CC|nr:glycosyl hydrolase [Burkholderia sp. Ax-1719]NIE65239.1 glycosyl hydrolase [Burkholderia sp. Ax-1719]
MSTGWETISTNFMKGDKPYGGGNFIIRGDKAISLKVAGPVITFKPASESSNPDVAEPTEDWMSDANQRMNRWTVSVLRGSINGNLVRLFSQPGQDGVWWHSPDWSTLYVSTGWMDYLSPIPSDGLTPQVTRLWRSSDGGNTWVQLNWPENHNIGHLLFLDATRSYAIGWGPHVWRTTDGGSSWHEIPTPPLASLTKPRATFDGVDLARDGTLRVAYYVDELHETKSSSVVYRLRWSDQQFEPETVLSGQTVVDMKSVPKNAGEDTIYALASPGPHSDTMSRGGIISMWTSTQPAPVRQLHEFAAPLSMSGLAVGVRGVLIAYATDSSGSGAPHDFSLYSTDAGKSWTQSDDGLMLGGYFDADTSTEYGLSAYTLKKRQF